MKLKAGNLNYQTIWNRLPKQRLREIHDFIKYNNLEPLSAERLVEALIDFGDKIAISPLGYTN